MIESLLSDQSVVTIAVLLVVQCTVVTGLALLLSTLRRGAAYRATVLKLGLYCVLLSPFATAVLVPLDIDGITIAIPDSNPLLSPQTVPIESEMTSVCELTIPTPPPPQSIAESTQTHHEEPEPLPALTLPIETTLASGNIPQTSTSESNPVSGWILSTLVIWAAGFLIGLIGLARSSLKLRRILRDAQPIDDDRLQAALRQVESTLAAKRPLHVVESPHVNGPVAAGIRRSAIVLPQGLLARVCPDELRAILLHEGAHVIRGDHLTLLLERLLAAAFWFHPLVHLLIRRLDRAREEVCDNYVLQAIDAPSYGETLLRLMQLSTSDTPARLAVGLFPGRWRLDERISGLLNEGRNTMTTTKKTGKILVACTLAIGALAVGTARVTAQPEPTPTDRSFDFPISAPPTPATPPKEYPPLPAATSSSDLAPSNKNNPFNRPVDTTRAVPAKPRDSRPANEPSQIQGYPLSADAFSRPDRSINFVTDSASIAHAQTKRGRIASVDMSRVITSYTKFQREMNAFRRTVEETAEKQQQQLKQRESLQVALKAIPKDNEEARAILQKIIEDNAVEAEQTRKNAQASAIKQETQLYFDIYREAQDAIQKYADYHKIELVLQMKRPTATSTETAPGHTGDAAPVKPQDILQQINRPVVYASGLDRDANNIEDITDVIIQHLNEKDKGRD